MAIQVIKARTRASNVEGLTTEINNAVTAEQARAVSAEGTIANNLANHVNAYVANKNTTDAAIQDILDAMQTDAEALTNYNALVGLINSGDANDQAAIDVLIAAAVKSYTERSLTVGVGGKIVLAKAPVNGVDSIDRLIVTFNGEDYDLLATEMDSEDEYNKTVLLGGNDFDGGTVKFIKYDYRLQDNSQAQAQAH